MGNLKDITVRAVSALASADIIFCEDTRSTRRILAHLNIADKKVVRYNEHSAHSLDTAMEYLRSAKNAVLVSDSGTPAVSDPGFLLVSRALDEKIEVDALPGPCAAVTAMSACGFGGGGFVFLGFLPRKKGKIIKAVNTAVAVNKPVIIYESPYRIAGLLETLCETLPPTTKIFIGRELTKMHQEYIRGTIADVLAELRKRPKILGEITLVISPATASNEDENV